MADLTNESQAKLAKAKSKGFIHTLVIEAIISDKSWDKIKDLLQLKLSNANIHTYTLPFTEIQQWEKESLAAYIHRFETEAWRCNFTNDATTIRIFVKGLKNVHSLATCTSMKRDLKCSLMPSWKWKKLNATQQLTATIIPPSMVNVMSHEEDCCF